MKFLVLSREELVRFISNLPPSLVVGVLLSGDRLSCCDEAVALEVDGEIIGVSTIAPRGEYGSGQPTLVALYIKPEFRRQGYGQKLAEAGVRRCAERGFTSVRVDAMSAYSMRILKNMPEDLRSVLGVNDLGNIMDFLI